MQDTDLRPAKCSTTRENSIERACAARGLRMTQQRRIIAHVLSEAHDHPDVFDLHRRAVALDKGLSLATVYRTVNLFEDCGIIERHRFGGSRARYEQAPHGNHDHLIDIKSGTVIEFRSEQVDQLKSEIARQLGYKIIHCNLEIYGVPVEDDG